MKGNCVDKFIIKKIDEYILDIINLRTSIRDRISIRDNNIDYFSIGCYEKDFNDIIKIRDNSNSILNNCNKFLERISEQYSKLN